MGWLNRLSLGRKLTVIIVGISAVTLLVACVAIVAYDLNAMRQAQIRQMATLADVTGQNVTAALASNDRSAAAEILAGSRVATEVVADCLYLPDGSLFASYVQAGHQCDEQPRTNRGHRSNAELTLSRPVMIGFERVGTIVMHCHPVQSVRRSRNYGLLIIFVLGGSSGLAFLLASRLQLFISKPVCHLLTITRAASAKRDYPMRAVSRTPDEIGQLIAGFNEMLEQLQQRDEELVEHRIHLQEEVATRTAELLRLNSDLTVAKNTAEVASRAKSESLANIIHEIRTSMNGVIGMLELTLDTSLKREQREYLQMAKTSSDSLLVIINDILDFLNIEAGKFELHKVEFDVPDAIAGTLKILAVGAHQKGSELVCHVASAVPRYAVGDPGRLKQVLVNLVGHAIKFTQHGEIVVDVDSSNYASGHAELCFSISDTGIGIPPEKQAVIFEGFEQANNSTTREYRGRGLGLAIAARLVGLMGGHISVESAAGKGSIFRFTAKVASSKCRHTRFDMESAINSLSLPPHGPTALAASSHDRPTWDRTVALDRLAGDKALRDELITLFLQEYPALARRLTAGLGMGDLVSLREPAHYLKGSLRHPGTSDSADVAREIEKVSHAQDHGRAAGLIDTIMKQVDAVQNAMQRAPVENPNEFAAV